MVSRRKFLSLIGASLAVAKASVCALPRIAEEVAPWKNKGAITIADLQAAYAQTTFDYPMTPDECFKFGFTGFKELPDVEVESC